MTIKEKQIHLRIKNEALPILKSGIVFKKKLLSVKAKNYLKRLKAFEKKHKMKSKEFIRSSMQENLVMIQSGLIGFLCMRHVIK